MKHFWTGIIKPVVESLKPKTIIEIGVDKGENTKNLLEYCSENECNLISIDPVPDNSLCELENKYENQFTLIRDLSLNVLPNIEDAEVIFIDGDHNWYTVYNELIAIQNTAKEYFPLTFLHDVDWPYARRDIYYNPNDIPIEYTNQYAKKGIDFNSKNLTEKYGFNSSIDNALEEGNAKNGVLTAVEDFLYQSNYELKFFKISGFHGLGIIYDQNVYLENGDFKRSIDDLIVSLEHIGDYISKLSFAHYHNISRNALVEGSIHSKNQEIKNLKNNKDKMDDLISNIKILSISGKSDIYKNFQILFSKYLLDKPISKKSKVAILSNIPYLFILLKSKGNIKKAWVNIRGYRAIERLELFDELYYLNKYKNILISGFNPLIHYIFYGYNENKFPSNSFNGRFYLNEYCDVKKSGINPLIHYSLYGIKEGKKMNKKIS